MHDAKPDRIEGINSQFKNNSWRIQYSPFNMDKTTRLKVSMKIEDLMDFVNQLVLTHLYINSTQQKQNTHSSYIHMEHSPEQTSARP